MTTPALFTAPGCARCKITKEFLKDRGIAFEELDFKGNGKDAFARFYRANRSRIYRDADGVEFPVFSDETQIRQGVSMIIGYLQAGDRLDGFIRRNRLHGTWLDGIDASGGPLDAADDLYAVLAHIKKFGLMIQVSSDGRNSEVLEALLTRKLADRAIVHVPGPLDLWTALLGPDTRPEDLTRSLSVAARFPEYRFVTRIAPFAVPGNDPQDIRFPTPEEIGQAAQLIETATGSKKHPFVIVPWLPAQENREEFKTVVPPADGDMFKYRSAARRYMVLAEIEKPA